MSLRIVGQDQFYNLKSSHLSTNIILDLHPVGGLVNVTPDRSWMPAKVRILHPVFSWISGHTEVNSRPDRTLTGLYRPSSSIYSLHHSAWLRLQRCCSGLVTLKDFLLLQGYIGPCRRLLKICPRCLLRPSRTLYCCITAMWFIAGSINRILSSR